jgi:hypothetical protein
MVSKDDQGCSLEDSDPTRRKERKIQVELYPDDYRILRKTLARQREIEECKAKWRELKSTSLKALAGWAVIAAATALVGGAVYYGKAVILAIAAGVKDVGPP